MENKPTIACVTPTIRRECFDKFHEAWKPLFRKHNVTLITVWDGDKPSLDVTGPLHEEKIDDILGKDIWSEHKDLFCRFTDACRNIGFVYAAIYNFDYVLTLDDDLIPPAGADPIQEHLDVLQKRVPIQWINTAHQDSPYLRGFPYGIREEAPVMLSHGVWCNVPDFDATTQLQLTNNWTERSKLPYTLPYYVGPIPRNIQWSHCGMNVMIRKKLLPYYYFAPMGVDSGFPDLHRFADIYLGHVLTKIMADRYWAAYTGSAMVIHTRASDPFKNLVQEKIGKSWNEWLWRDNYHTDDDHPGLSDDARHYKMTYAAKRTRYAQLIYQLQKSK